MKADPAEILAYMEAHLDVEDPASPTGVLPYTPNEGQRRLLETRAARLEPCCLVPFKTRQIGHTTFWLLYSFALMMVRPGSTVSWLVPGDRMRKIQAKWRTIVRSVTAISGKFTDAIKHPNPATGFPGVDAHRDEIVEFRNGSRITWTEVGDSKLKAAKAGIGETIDLMVLCEFGHWKYSREAFDAARPAVERARGTMVCDTTPPDIPGKGEKWLELANIALRGTDPWVETVTLPWWMVDEFRSRIPARNLTADERALGLDPFQIQWRRTQIEDLGAKFFRLYCETPEQSLMPTGALAFDPGIVRRLVEDRARGRLPDGDIQNLEHGYVARWSQPGPFTVKPVLGVDPSEGVPSGDPIALCLLDSLGEIAVTGRLWEHPLIAAGRIQELAEAYGADIAIEKASAWETIRNAILWAVPDEECKHPANARRFTGRVDLMAAQRRHDRTAASREYVDSGYPVPDPNIIDEILQRDPNTGKAANNGEDDLLDALGVARYSRLRATYRPASQGLKFGKRRST